jgi:hypothetical protein
LTILSMPLRVYNCQCTASIINLLDLLISVFFPNCEFWIRYKVPRSY